MAKFEINPYLSESSIGEIIRTPRLIKIPNVHQLVNAGCLDELIEFFSSTFLQKSKPQTSKKSKFKWLLAYLLSLIKKFKFKRKKKKSNKQFNKNLSLATNTLINTHFLEDLFIAKIPKLSFNFWPLLLITSKKLANPIPWMVTFLILPKLAGGYLPIKVMHDTRVYENHIKSSINDLQKQFQNPSILLTQSTTKPTINESIGINLTLKELRNTQYKTISTKRNTLENLWNWNLGIDMFHDTLDWITQHVSANYIKQSETKINELWQQKEKTKESPEITVEKYKKWIEETKQDYATYKSYIQNIFNIYTKNVDELFKETNRKFINNSIEKITKDLPEILSKQLLNESNQIKESIGIYMDLLKKLDSDYSNNQKITNLKNEISSLYKNLENKLKDYKDLELDKEQIKTLDELQEITKKISENSSNYLTIEKLEEIQKTQEQVLDKVINSATEISRDILEKKHGGIEAIKSQISSIDEKVISSDQKQQINNTLDVFYGDSNKEISEEQIIKSLETLEKTPSRYEGFWRNHNREFQKTSNRWASKCAYGFQWLCRGTWDYFSGGIFFNVKNSIRSYNMFGKVDWSTLLDVVGNIVTVVSLVSLVNSSFALGTIGLNLAAKSAITQGIRLGTKRALVNAGQKLLTNTTVIKETAKKLGLQAHKGIQKALLNGKMMTTRRIGEWGSQMVVDKTVTTIAGLGAAGAVVVGGSLAVGNLDNRVMLNAQK